MQSEMGTSRPKIHRLPEQTAIPGGPFVSPAILIVCIAALMLAAIPALWSMRKVGTVRVEEIPAAGASLAGSAESETIAVQDDSGKIVGQLTRMPADIEHATNVKTTSKLDQKTGKELMNIISKY